MHRKAAIHARHHPIAPQQIGIAADALRDQFGVLDLGALRLDHAGAQDLAFRQRMRLEERKLMRVARVRTFDQYSLRLGRPDDVGDFVQRDIAMVRTGIVAPQLDKTTYCPVGIN